MKAGIGVTDAAWAAYLRDRPHLTEANFWVPKPRATWRVADSGSVFLFKTHWPANQLVGGGFVSGYARLRVSEAWELFGEGNGVGSQRDLLRAITAYRKDQEPDPLIGCLLLRDLFFAREGGELDGPADFAKNIVQWKSYDAEGSVIEDAMVALLARSLPRGVDSPTYGDPRLMVPRVGQIAFRGLVLDAYQRRCAITGDRIRPVLQAAHIRPISREGKHRVSNGLLLRSDVHTLFDEGYLGIDEKYRLHVSPRLRTEFGNGTEFYARAGEQITVPARRADRPASDAVTWHMDEVFLR